MYQLKDMLHFQYNCLNNPDHDFNFHLTFEFELYPYYNDTVDWIEDSRSIVCMTYNPEITPWKDEPHIFRQYQGEKRLHIFVSVRLNSFKGKSTICNFENTLCLYITDC